jgi:hypothetical protein
MIPSLAILSCALLVSVGSAASSEISALHLCPHVPCQDLRYAMFIFTYFRLASPNLRTGTFLMIQVRPADLAEANLKQWRLLSNQAIMAAESHRI